MTLFTNIIQKLSNRQTTVYQEKPEITEDHVNENIPAPYQRAPLTTMRQLLDEGCIPCKMTQSRPGNSVERVFAEYAPNEITIAQDDTEWLSFVNADKIALCILYGDNLTIFETDAQTLHEKGILDQPVIIKGLSFGEMTAQNLLTKEVCSLKNPETLVRMIEMSSDDTVFYFMAMNAHQEIEQRLRDMDCDKTADFLHYESLQYSYNAHEFKENIGNDYERWNAFEHEYENSRD